MLVHNDCALYLRAHPVHSRVGGARTGHLGQDMRTTRTTPKSQQIFQARRAVRKVRCVAFPSAYEWLFALALRQRCGGNPGQRTGFRPSCSEIHLSWCAAQTLEAREILEASGIMGRTPLPLTAPRACSRRSPSCREASSNRVRHARRSYPRARLEQRACRQRPPHSGQACCALRNSRGRNQESVEFGHLIRPGGQRMHDRLCGCQFPAVINRTKDPGTARIIQLYCCVHTVCTSQMKVESCAVGKITYSEPNAPKEKKCVHCFHCAHNRSMLY